MPSPHGYPPEWPGRIRALASGELIASTPRRAATIMLLRDASGGVPDDVLPGGVPGGVRDHVPGGGPDPEDVHEDAPDTDGAPASPAGRAGLAVHMVRRRTSMPFAAGAYAYPGGAVDPCDDEAPVGWAGPSRAWWADRLGVDEAGAQAIVCAAVRETFEEAGVLLAGPAPDALVSDITGADWEADRQALIAHDLSFARFLARRGLLLRSDLLGAWARWITPEFEPRRYDTWFFVAALPAGQRAASTSDEADHTLWIAPAQAAAGYDRGELHMLPPTIATLRQLSAYATVDLAWAAAAGRDLTPVLTRARLEAGEVVLSWPGHDEFTHRLVTPQAGEGSI